MKLYCIQCILLYKVYTYMWHCFDTHEGFEYRNDSVIKVHKWEFYHCNRTHPVSSAKDGNRTFNLNRVGPVYFTSGDPEHCKKGQRLSIEVLPLHPISQSPPQPPPISVAPSPAPLSYSLAAASSVPAAVILAVVVSVIVAVAAASAWLSVIVFLYFY